MEDRLGELFVSSQIIPPLYSTLLRIQNLNYKILCCVCLNYSLVVISVLIDYYVVVVLEQTIQTTVYFWELILLWTLLGAVNILLKI
jgi:hypothetical protein